jgi:hypothetical protein
MRNRDLVRNETSIFIAIFIGFRRNGSASAKANGAEPTGRASSRRIGAINFNWIEIIDVLIIIPKQFGLFVNCEVVINF